MEDLSEIIESDWEIRDRVNRGQYMQRAARGAFLCCLKDVTKAKVEGDLAGLRGYLVGYMHRETGIRAFTVHFFVNDPQMNGPEGTPGFSGNAQPNGSR